MKRIFGRPVFWLSLQLAVTFGVLAWAGGLQYTRVPDTASYLYASQSSSLTAALSHHRTIGYPLFLRAVLAAGHWLRPVPILQIALFFGSLYLFRFALERFSGSGWLAYAAVLPLPWAGVMNLATYVQPDFLAAVAAVVAFSFLFLLTVGPGRVGWWLGLALAVFCAYQLRPAAVFLIAFVPVLGLLLKWLRGVRRWRRLWPWLLLISVATLTPFLMFCTLRWVTVGHFGVVSFGGPNLAGLAANFLDRKLIRELPDEHRSVAKNMLVRRRERGWTAMRLDSDIYPHLGQYSDNIWRVAIPAADKEVRQVRRQRTKQRKVGHRELRPIRVEQNELLTRVSRAIIRQRPALYFKWVSRAVAFGLKQLADYVWILAPLFLVLVSAPVASLRSRFGAPQATAAGPPTIPVLVSLLLLGVGYFAAYLVLVSLVSFPFHRYFVSMTLFLPTALCAQLFAIWRRILTTG